MRIRRSKIFKSSRRIPSRVNRLRRTRDMLVTSHPISAVPSSSAHLNICLHRMLGGVGDILMSTVAARGLKEKFPNCTITYAVTPGYMHGSTVHILEGCIYLDKIIDESNMVKTDYDYYVLFNATDFPQETERINKERIDMYCDYIGVSPKNKVPFYHITDEERKYALDFMNKFTNKRVPTIFIGSFSASGKRSLSLNQLYGTVMLLLHHGYNVLVDHFKPYIDKDMLKDYEGRLVEHVASIRKSAAVQNLCDYMIVPDSLSLHIAGALRKRGIAIFTHTHPDSRLTYFAGMKPLFLDLDCLCWWQHCTRKQHDCILGITPEMIVDKLEGVISEYRPDLQPR